MVERTEISKTMAYLLRHDPSGMRISDKGFVVMEELLTKLKEKWPNINEKDIIEVIERDPKGRYEIKNGKVRARYGHSIEVNPTLNQSKKDVLYHGTTEKASKKILREGIKSQGRQKVHLSATIQGAYEVGKRRTNKPVILKIDAKKAQKENIKIERASDKVYVTDKIPPKHIKNKKYNKKAK